MRDNFDFLSLRLAIGQAAPSEFRPVSGCWDFFLDPGDPSWDWRFSRVLVHETLHFWQLLGSTYLQRLMTAEWKRFCTFERESRIEAPAAELAAFRRIDHRTGFSAEQLMEAWARFWEIDIQTPIALLEQEGIDLEQIFPAVVQWLGEGAQPRYPWLGIEIAMLSGRHCGMYGAPFRWLLDRIKEETADPGYTDHCFSPARGNPSFAACVCFPILVYHSLQDEDPPGFFARAVDAICESGLARMSLGNHSGSIPIEWFRRWARVSELIEQLHSSQLLEDVEESWAELPLPPPLQLAQMTGVDFGRSLAMLGSRNPRHPYNELPREAFRKHGMAIAFAFMGFHDVRRALSITYPPPYIRFSDATHLSVPGELRLVDGQFSLAPAQPPLALYESAAQRVDRFRRAERAVSLGLPADAFDR